MYVVVIRTAGNQRYIFATNRRQEIVGASDLIARVNETWAFDALRTVAGAEFTADWRIGTHPAELVVAGAGLVVVLVEEHVTGQGLVSEVTERALREAPGLDVCGVVVEAGGEPLRETIRAAYRELSWQRDRRPGPQSRHLRLPLAQDCESSGLPAMEIRSEGNGEEPRPRSAAAAYKIGASRPALHRLAGICGTTPAEMRAVVDRLGLTAEWVAVVHADGNGLGDLFRGLAGHPDAQDDRGYAELFRQVSAGVDDAAKRALLVALRRTAEQRADGETPAVLPLIVGGDDLTVVCEGDVALPFAQHYLEAFEAETAAHPLLGKTGRARLTAAAGVAIVKRNYPFHFAYDLAEELISKEAKRVKEHGSALAFVVLYESAAPDLARIRESVTPSGSAGRSASPYMVGTDGAGGPRWDDLLRRADALRRRDRDSGERLIPGGVAHDLCEGLCLGADVARARLWLARRRVAGNPERERALDDLTAGERFWDGPSSPDDLDSGERTGLMDAMAAVPFLPAETGTAAR
ncbi:hypothetical protein C1I98_36005 [Spongiactinospora gelatinilytica]|uniref:Cas10/Cmr2 second palm domain-containing protein n=1 Tax=Spongiactinospora gelatinilytica TaxID=2666298 RepID=A0A2W2F3G8_9ACTN|nr:hypothetical protein [Spongiactinospora gelatinilytica]PZG23919.1 hypothetical protein C1I98_36005 [Spongiactinospora gelatinilytica]